MSRLLNSKNIIKLLGAAFLASILITSFVATYIAGFGMGVNKVKEEFEKELTKIASERVSSQIQEEYKMEEPIQNDTPRATSKPKQATLPATWGGPQLWEAVNKRRVQLGVNGLSSKEELCTIASIRLNQILSSGTLDGHEGFSKLPEQRPDLKPIFEKYNLSEFLVAGATSPENAVSLWENSMGHKQLLTGGEYVWGCIYAQSGFAVAIAAY